MSNKRFFFVMIGGLVLTIAAVVATVVLGSSMLQKKSNALMELKLENRTLEEQQVALVQAKKDIEKYEDLEKISKSVVPQDKDQARTVREIVDIASEFGIAISGISFPSSNLGAAQPKPTTQSSEGSSTSTPSTTTPAAPPITQVTPVDGLKGVYEMSIDVTLDSSIPYSRLISFLERLEQNRRTAQVTALNINPDPRNRNLVNFDLTIKVYVKP